MKTLDQLKERVAVTWHSYGTSTVEITYYGKKYRCTTHNTIATDIIRADDYTRTRDDYYTEKQAYIALYEECMEKNGLGKYNYY